MSRIVLPATTELRERDEAEAWVAAGVCLSRLARPDPDDHAACAAWALAALSEAGALPPIGIIADIGFLLTGRSLRATPLPAVGGELRDAVGGYEDHVLGRLEADPRIDAISDAIARLAAHQRDAAIGLFCTHLLSRIGFDAAVSLGHGVARHVLFSPVDEVVALGHATTTERGAVFDAITRGYRSLTAAARRYGTLISEPEVFLMENFEALGGLTLRLAIEQMLEVSGALADALPGRLKPRPRVDPGRIPTSLAADASYPTGGFSSLSNAGSLENLVTSELMYMEDRPPIDPGRGSGRAPSGPVAGNGDGGIDGNGDIDLFDLRYAEGELLYYTRDESVFVRNRRDITFVFTPDLAEVRFKDAELRWQRLIAALGLVAFCTRRLATWLDGESLFFRAAFPLAPAPADLPRDPLAGERGLCALLLREWTGKEMAEVVAVDDLAHIVEQAHDTARTCETTIIFFTARPLELLPEPGLRAANVCLGDPEPRLAWAHRLRSAPADPPAPSPDLWQEWVRTALDLLQELL